MINLISGKHKTPDPDDIELTKNTFSPRMPSYAELVKQVFNGCLSRLMRNMILFSLTDQYQKSF